VFSFKLVIITRLRSGITGIEFTTTHQLWTSRWLVPCKCIEVK